MENEFLGLKNYINRMDTLNDTSVYIGVTPETDIRSNELINGVSSDLISKKVFGHEPINSNATLLLLNITGGMEYSFDGDEANKLYNRNDLGSFNAHISKRDFITPVFENNKNYIIKNLREIVKLKSNNDIGYRTLLENISKNIATDIREYARIGDFLPNNPTYSKLKGGLPPLHATNQMIESITGEVIEK